MCVYLFILFYLFIISPNVDFYIYSMCIYIYIYIYIYNRLSTAFWTEYIHKYLKIYKYLLCSPKQYFLSLIKNTVKTVVL